MRTHIVILKRACAMAVALFAAAGSMMAQTISIKFNGNTASVNVPSNVTNVTKSISGANVTITSGTTDTEYTYEVSGTTANGSLTINGSYKLTLRLNGVSITSQTGAAIDVQCGKRIAVDVADGTVNTLVDKAGGSQKAAMYFTGHPEFSGSGTLNVTGNTKHAISAKEYLQIKGKFGTLNVLSAVSDGIHCGKEKVQEWDEEMAKNENEFFRCNGGVVNIGNCGGDCIDAGSYGCMVIKGGALNLAVSADDVCAMKSPNMFIIEDGQINIGITGTGSDGIYVNNEARMMGGEINIDVQGNGSKGIKGKLKASTGYTNGGNVKLQGTRMTVVARGGDDMTDPADPSHCVGISVDGNLALSGDVKVTAVRDARGITCDGTKTGSATELHQHWYASPYDYQYDMTAYFTLSIGGVKQLPANAELAAFVGDECRGVAEALPGVDGVYYMRLRSNAATGDNFTFKAYADEKEIEVEAAESVTFNSQAQVGSPANPVAVNDKKADDTGVGAALAASTAVEIYTITGVKQTSIEKGVNIIIDNNGNTKKIIK